MTQAYTDLIVRKAWNDANDAQAASAERDGRCDEKRTDDHHADAERGEPLDADAYAAADG